MRTAEPQPIIHLVAGSTGAGKTTYARALAERTGSLQFSIDDWMTGLFWADSPQPMDYAWAIERVGRCEAMIWRIAAGAARRGSSWILDLGFTRAEHRARFADLARAEGLPVMLHFVDVPADERWARVQRRNAERGDTFAMEVDRAMFDFMEDMWEPPGEDEMAALNGVRSA